MASRTIGTVAWKGRDLPVSTADWASFDVGGTPTSLDGMTRLASLGVLSFADDRDREYIVRLGLRAGMGPDAWTAGVPQASDAVVAARDAAASGDAAAAVAAFSSGFVGTRTGKGVAEAIMLDADHGDPVTLSTVTPTSWARVIWRSKGWVPFAAGVTVVLWAIVAALTGQLSAGAGLRVAGGSLVLFWAISAGIEVDRYRLWRKARRYVSRVLLRFSDDNELRYDREFARVMGSLVRDAVEAGLPTFVPVEDGDGYWSPGYPGNFRLRMIIERSLFSRADTEAAIGRAALAARPLAGMGKKSLPDDWTVSQIAEDEWRLLIGKGGSLVPLADMAFMSRSSGISMDDYRLYRLRFLPVSAGTQEPATSWAECLEVAR